MGNSRLNQLPPLAGRLSQKTALSLRLLPQPPAVSSLQPSPGLPGPTQAQGLLLSCLSSQPEQSRAGSRCSQPLPQGRQLKKAKKTQAVCVFLPGFLCSNLWSPVFCKRCLLSCLSNVHLTTEESKVRKAWRSGAGSRPRRRRAAWPGPT